MEVNAVAELEKLDLKENLTLGSGKVLQTDYVSVIPEPPRCYIRMENLTMADAAVIFSNPAETGHMLYGSIKIDEFKSLLSLSMDGNAILITLKK